MAEAGDARRLLKDLPAVGGLHRQNLVNAALTDEGIALPAQTGVHKQLIDVPQAHRTAVDIVLALPRAVVPPGDHDLALVQIKEVSGVVQHQGDLGISRLAALGGAAEDHILHFAAPQGTGGLLPHDPANGAGNIGFSRTVGAHDAVISSPKVSTVLSGKDLKPWISNALRYISTPLSSHNLLSPLFQGVPGFWCLHNPHSFL